MHGHFDLSKLEMDNLVEDTLLDLKVNMGIAVVVPVWKILEVMGQDVFMQNREAFKQEVLSRDAPTADSGDESFTKDDFEDALKKVTRSIKPYEPEKEQS